jgi:4-amino-4-deoxy-L-arabinose transferase-like glycosyltransferase
MSSSSDRPATRGAQLGRWVWLGFAGIAVLYLAAIVRLHPANFFGVTQDDTIYFSSAQALASGRGYVLPSVPGAPAATKYPILYPWILSWVWRLNPSFPSNLLAALGITAAFGIAYVALAFAFLRRLGGIGGAEALLLTAFCALQPTVLFYSASLNSDIPFAAMALAAMLLADRATEPGARGASTLGCAIVTALAILLRVLGVPIGLGIFFAALARRAWKQAAIFAACTAPSLAWLAWQAAASARYGVPAGFDSAGPGFMQTWLYYTSYVGFRKLSMLNAHLVGSMLLDQFTYIFTELPGYFLSPLFHKNIPLLFVCTLIVFWMIFAGLVREIHLGGWRPVHFAFLFTIAATLAWDYPAVQRFMIPFLPLLAASLWLEGKRWAGQLAAAARQPRPGVERIVATLSAAALGAVALGIAWNFVANKDRAQQRQDSAARGALLAEKQQAYDWFRLHAPDGARAVAAEDGAFYLYTGRQAMAQMELRRAGAYDPAYLQQDLAHMTDVASAIGAEYWVASPDDSDKQWVAAKPFLAARLGEIESGLPELFRSSGGHVRIYGLAPAAPAGAKASQ